MLRGVWKGSGSCLSSHPAWPTLPPFPVMHTVAVEGVTIYITDFKRSITEKLARVGCCPVCWACVVTPDFLPLSGALFHTAASL